MREEGDIFMLKRTGSAVRLVGILSLLSLAPEPAALLAQGQSTAHRAVGLIIFDLTPDRVSPTMMTVSKGWYLIRVRNGITLSSVSVQLNHETAGAVISSNIKSGASGLEQLAQLQPGKHTLVVGGRTKWTATLVVTPN
jgi:hypothetical protein